MYTDTEIYNFLLSVYIPELEKTTVVKALYLRGSRYVGNYKPDSDWDFTIVVSKLVFGVKKPSVENYPIDICLSLKKPEKAKLIWNT